jgi:hypothetical protein
MNSVLPGADKKNSFPRFLLSDYRSVTFKFFEIGRSGVRKKIIAFVKNF